MALGRPTELLAAAVSAPNSVPNACESQPRPPPVNQMVSRGGPADATFPRADQMVSAGKTRFKVRLSGTDFESGGRGV